MFRGQDITALSDRTMRPIRAGIQMVFQDPYESLDPRQTVFDLVAEPLTIHGRATDPAERRRVVLGALSDAGLHPAAEIARRHPHHLSGGQRQRVAVAATMVLDPDVIVADEPTSMLDVSLRAGILRLMLDLREQRQVSCLFITHDLSLAWVVADRIAVVYLGRIVEIGPSAEVIANPKHPYTKALVSVIPVPEAGAAADQTRAGRRDAVGAERPAGLSLPSAMLALRGARTARGVHDDRSARRHRRARRSARGRVSLPVGPTTEEGGALP